uniref:Amidase domain-containing protein n=1 Tax=Mesocestoides corti TaxID=53468 RepID=A0A5K3FW33_MESCO
MFSANDPLVDVLTFPTVVSSSIVSFRENGGSSSCNPIPRKGDRSNEAFKANPQYHDAAQKMCLHCTLAGHLAPHLQEPNHLFVGIRKHTATYQHTQTRNVVLQNKPQIGCLVWVSEEAVASFGFPIVIKSN